MDPSSNQDSITGDRRSRAGEQNVGAAGGARGRGGPADKQRMCQFKLVLLGESAVGKSSLVLRFVKGQFHEYQESTIGGK